MESGRRYLRAGFGVGVGILLILVCGCIGSEPGDSGGEIKQPAGGSGAVQTQNAIENITAQGSLNQSNITSNPEQTTGEKTGLKPETKNETKLETKNETKLETKNETNNETNNETKIELKIEPAPEPKPVLSPQIMRVRFEIDGAYYNTETQELESKLQYDLPGVIYAKTSAAERRGEVVYDESIITKETVIKEAGFIKAPGESKFTKGFFIRVTDYVNCTKTNNGYRCCYGRECEIY